MESDISALKLIFVALLCAPLLYLAISFAGKLRGGIREDRDRQEL